MCNRPLRDPLSIKLGIGPVCRGESSSNKAPARQPTDNLFSNQLNPNITTYVTKGKHPVFTILQQESKNPTPKYIEAVLEITKWQREQENTNQYILFRSFQGMFYAISPDNKLINLKTQLQSDAVNTILAL